MKTLHKMFRAACLGSVALPIACGEADPPPDTEAVVQSRENVILDMGDLDFILQQTKIAEAHAAGASLPTLVESPLLPFGLRTVNGTLNNLLPGQEQFGAADRRFPRLTPPVLRPAEGAAFDPDGPGPRGVGSPTSYAQNSGLVFDSRPRVISNLIVDQTANNPAAVAAAAQTPGSLPNVDGDGTFFIPNVAPDVGLSAPYNSWFTLFGQFFDHGLDLVKKGGSGTLFVPLAEDDPLFDPANPNNNFMILSRASNEPGPDGIRGNADDVHEHQNLTTSFVDQNQTYTSHPSHQVFLREYALDAAGRPVATGRMFDGARGGIGNWAEVKLQARNLLGLALGDAEVTNGPLLATDAYGRFLRGPGGFPQIVTSTGLVEGNPAAPVATSGAQRTGHPFLADIAHSAAPNAGLAPDGDGEINSGPQPAGTYDNELLDAHFATGDGRGNENIGLTAVHTIFHAEHNRLVEEVKTEVLATANPAFVAEWLVPGADPTDGIQPLEWNGERLFQAARFGTEMQYQHLVFEEFARKVQPEVNVFAGYDTSIDPAIMAEFAHTVYRFGHSLLTETVARTRADGTADDLGLIPAFLNPPAFSGGYATDTDAAAAIVRGMTRQVGNEADEFVTDALRNNLLGVPLDLATINILRGRDTGIPGLNDARALFFADTGNSALQPYTSWTDYAFALRHQASLPNFVAAYGTHPTITAATTVAAKRAAAVAIVEGGPDAPPDSADFLAGTGDWATAETGLNHVDFWVGGLAEKQMVFGGLLGPTFNFVFETQMEKLQDGDRFYYLSRTAGLNFFTQLEENSFSELVMRNTDVKHLPLDIFSRPAFVFELANIGASGPILDDPATPDQNESELLTRMPDGTVRYAGAEHVVMGGTPGADRMRTSEGDDTLWGDEGNDRLEGGDGNDSLNGGEGDDIITDLNGIDNIKGGPGNDVINAGPGFGDLILAGSGHDFVVAGADPKETFAGQGNDFVIAGDSADTVFGGEGDDWIEGGDQADLLQGDNGDPFQESKVVGNDVIFGQGGNDDYDAESGDDIMVSDFGVERHEGMLGFDWVTYKGAAQPADADFRFTGLLPPTVDALRDRFDLVEGLSGSHLDDLLRGDDRVSADFTAIDPGSGQNNALNTAAQIALIDGLQALLGAGVTAFGGGNVILGGEGSDVLEGRGGDDILDGDAWLNVRIRVVDAGDTPIAHAETMNAVLTDKSGALAATPAGLTLQQAMFAGTINPGQLRIVREIVIAPAGAHVDTAVFSGPVADYDLVTNPDGSVTVVHARGTATDGTDRLIRVEQLQFQDGTVPAVPPPSAPLTPASLAFGDQELSSTSPSQTVTLRNTSSVPLAISTAAVRGVQRADFVKGADSCSGATLAPAATCTVAVAFRPTALGARSATLAFSTNGSPATQSAALSGNGTPATVAASPPNLAFGDQTLEVRSAPRQVVITNTGASPLQVTGATIAGTNVNDFGISANTCNGTLAPNASCSVSVRFRPRALGGRSAELRIAHGAPTSPKVVPMSGNGTP